MGTISPSTPLAGVEPVQPMASTCSLCRVGASSSPSAVPRFQPRRSCHFSARTFSSPMARILAMPQSMAFCASGVPVTRAPTLSLSSVKYWNACEFIMPSPAIFVSAGLVPSSSGPLKRSSARASFTLARLKARTDIPTLVSNLRLRSSPQHHSAPQPIMSDVLDYFRFQFPLQAVMQTVLLLSSLRTSALSASLRCPSPLPADVSFLKLARETLLYLIFGATYTPNGAPVARLPNFYSLRLVCGVIWLCALGVLPARSQQPASPPAKQSPKSAEAPEKRPELPAQIELLETRVRFETNGDSRKEVHTRVHINDELGARQFARLTFDYNRSFQQIEFALLRITHASGGTADILPSAISDQLNPAVINAPAYQDIRVKSVRILGLAPGDVLEYRVVTTISHHPLAPDFWLDYSFDHTGVVTEELFEIDVPASRKVQLHVEPELTYEIIESENRTDARVAYRWKRPGAPQGAAPDGVPH